MRTNAILQIAACRFSPASHPQTFADMVAYSPDNPPHPAPIRFSDEADSPLSVAGLTRYIHDLIETDKHLRQVWVVGEVSSATQYRSGIFFTLQDPDADVAISAVVWNNRIRRLAVMPEPGEQIVVLGQVRVHEKRGAYQLNVWQALPAGEGLRALRYRQLRQRLSAEGLFDAERKRSLPAHPKYVAVVTSPQAAAWGDILRTLRRRYPGLRILFSPALVQGDQAPTTIVQAIERVQQDGRADVLIVSRGGGATEDMTCFNDERVVRAISDCRVPVVSGIGHQRDETLADLVADFRVHTPTAAAEQAVPKLSEVASDHQERVVALQQAVETHLHHQQEKLARLRSQLRHLRLAQRVQREQRTVSRQRLILLQAAVLKLQDAEHHCQMLSQTLHSLDPATVLRRGYALVRQENGDIVRSSTSLSPGQTLQVQLAEGSAEVEVLGIKLPDIPTDTTDKPSPTDS
ncbi:MAG: exodeoxyribonuclease VII large subunit [Cyanobacteria bacterium P01_A01_bin.135]